MADTALSQRDVERLLVDRSPAARIETMSKVVAHLDAGSFGEREREIAQDILRRFAADAETAVREAMAWQVVNSPTLSEELAEKLARDVARVAFPVLRHAKRLDDRMLLSIIEERDSRKDFAIAGRDGISEEISDALVETSNLSVIVRLLNNRGARIGEETLGRALDRYGTISSVHGPLAEREGLSLTVVEKLIQFVSDDIRRTLVARYRISATVASDLVSKAQEAATVLMLKPMAGNVADLELVVRHLHQRRRLTPSFLFRALCGGDVNLFILGMAVRCRISADSVQLLIWDDGPLGLRAAFDAGGIASVLLPPFRVALSVAKEMDYDGGDERRRDFQIRVLARVFDECGHIGDHQVDDLLIQLFDQKAEDVIDEAMAQAGMPFVPVRSVS